MLTPFTIDPDVARAVTIVAGCVAEPSLLGPGAGGALDPMEMENEAAVLSVQRAVRLRFYAGGRYSPQHERGAHQFHRLIAEAPGNRPNQ
jgi:choline monooxygenase